ncbi:hypothetical protein FOL47_011249 [Perkinsus chesapeaki]|uniref:Nodulin-like domain-containing protein n=1 Tax=Perkinsus chesapeaki TaxID=330153 RepID=A0A7J6MMR6_PERCH|nr:hypothetical protein FOL47_011249 [Perkinsus chesapeaki]
MSIIDRDHPMCPNVAAWATAAASLPIMLICGSVYTFGLYSEQLKFALDLSQSQLTYLSLAFNAGNGLSVFGGVFCDKYGPRPTILFGSKRGTRADKGSLLVGVGYVLVWLPSRLGIWTPLPPILCFLCVGQGVGWMDSALVSTNTKNFPWHRGKLVGIVKAFYGLSASFLVCVTATFLSNNTLDFLVTVAIASPIIAAIGSRFIFVVHEDVSVEYYAYHRCFVISYGMLLILAVVLTVYSLAPSVLPGAVAFTTSLVVILPTVLYLPIAVKTDVRSLSDPRAKSDPMLEQEPLEEMPTSDRRCYKCVKNGPASMLTGVFWLYFVALLTGLGGGLTVINNSAQIGLAAGLSKSAVASMVSMISIGNAAGRVLSGRVSDSLVVRPWALLFGLVFAGCAIVGMAYGKLLNQSTLLVELLALRCPASSGALPSGRSAGTFWSLMAAICAELYGRSHLAATYALTQVAQVTGSFLLASLTFGRLYDRESTFDGNKKVCISSACYSTSFAINIGCLLVGCVATLWMIKATNSFYRVLHMTKPALPSNPASARMMASP